MQTEEKTGIWSLLRLEHVGVKDARSTVYGGIYSQGHAPQQRGHVSLAVRNPTQNATFLMEMVSESEGGATVLTLWTENAQKQKAAFAGVAALFATQRSGSVQ